MSDTKFFHKPVLLDEAIEALNIKSDGVYVDATVGGGGHSLEIAKRLKGGMLYSFDRDIDAISAARDRLKDYKVEVINENYSNIKDELKKRGVNNVDGIIFDLGVSSHQLDSEKRGFSYLKEAKIDMRMGINEKSGYEIVNEYKKEDLIKIFYEYGEERYSKQIANAIIKEREKEKIETTTRLNEIIKSAIPKKARRDKNPSRRVYQAIRMEVNDELYHLGEGLKDAISLVKSKGRIVVITFHSVEDRVVKNMFSEWCRGCECPKDFPICVCNKKAVAKWVGKKAIKPKEEEINENRRSRSAILRVVEKI